MTQKFLPNVTILPVALIQRYMRGELNDADFAAAVVRYGWGYYQRMTGEAGAAAPAARPTPAAPVVAPERADHTPRTVDEGLRRAFLDGLAEFIEADRIAAIGDEQVDNLVRRMTDHETVAALLTILRHQHTHREPVRTPGNFAGYLLSKNTRPELLAQAARIRESEAGEESYVKRLTAVAEQIARDAEADFFNLVGADEELP